MVLDHCLHLNKPENVTLVLRLQALFAQSMSELSRNLEMLPTPPVGSVLKINKINKR